MVCFVFSFFLLVTLSTLSYRINVRILKEPRYTSCRLYGNFEPKKISSAENNSYGFLNKKSSALALAVLMGINVQKSVADTNSSDAQPIDFGAFRVPYFHENMVLKQYFGGKATIVFNMKIDDPQTIVQFPAMNEIYAKYKDKGLNILVFPTEQGWFEADDDETIRLKAKEYYGFGDYPNAVVFDKVDLLGPSANPFYRALTNTLLTPNGYGRITLNYEKFLLDSHGYPVRRYPRKFSVFDMESDIQALLNNEPLPPESSLFMKSWKEAKRELVKSEYSFRYNYNYYTAPDSMYKYDPKKDA
jgi:glutathione peroxidase